MMYVRTTAHTFNLHLIVSAGSGSHYPFPMQVDMLEPMGDCLGKGEPNVTLLPGIARSV